MTLGSAPEDLAVLRRNRDLGVTRMTVRLPPAKDEEPDSQVNPDAGPVKPE